MQRLNEISVGKSVTQCIYGAAGTGKTAYAGTCGTDDVLYIDCENRKATLQSPWFKAKYPKFNPIVATFNEDILPQGGARALDEMVAFIKDASIKYPDAFKVLFIDGTTSLRRWSLNKALELGQQVGKQTLAKLDASKKVLNTDLIVPSGLGPGDYGIEIQMMEKFLYKMLDYVKDAEKHFILTAHERYEYAKADKQGGPPLIVKIKPGFTGQTFPDTIPGMFDFVWRFETLSGGSQRTYRALTEGDAQVIAKSPGTGIWPVNYQDPKFLDVVKKFQGGK